MHIGDDSLDLDDQQDSCGSVEGQQVDAAALAEAAERGLRADLPRGRLEPSLHQVLERGVCGIQEPVELPAAPTSIDSQVDLHRFADPLQRTNREPVRSVPFELRDGPSAHAGATREVYLTPSEANP